MKNAESDVILYAKNHYERTDVVEDLKVIYGKRNGVEPKYLQKGNIAGMML